VGFILEAFPKLSIEASNLVDLKHERTGKSSELSFRRKGCFGPDANWDTVNVLYFNCLKLQ